MKRLILILTAAFSLGLGACSDEPTNPAPQVASVTVDPANFTLTEGDTLRVEAAARGADGTPIADAPLVWETESAAVATVSGTGNRRLVTAHQPGNTRVSVFSAGKYGHLAITVLRRPPAVAVVGITPAGARLTVGETLPLAAVLKAADGEVLESRQVEWVSASPTVGQVIRQNSPETAVLTALSPGIVVIRAASEGVLGEAEFEVVAAPSPVTSIEVSGVDATLDAGALDTVRAFTLGADGSVLTGRPIQWSVTANAAVIAVSMVGDSGVVVVRGVGPGVAILTVRSEGARRDVVYTVNAPPPQKPVHHVLIRPNPAGLWVGYARELEALTLAADGTQLSGRAVTWSVEDTLIAKVDSTGKVTGRGAGVTRLVAESEGKRGYAELHVWQNTLVVNLALTYNWWDGQVRLAEPVGLVQYLDDQGITRTATLHVLAGTFTINRLDWTYQRELVAEAWAPVGGVLRKVGEQRFSDRGTVAHRSENGTAHFEFISALTPGLRYTGVARAPGEVLVSLPLAGGQLRDLLFRLP